MKQMVLLASFLMGMTLLRAQAPTTTSTLDNSPLDMSYYPVNYPVLKVQDKVNEPLIARVVYSRPQKRGSKLFGDLISYGQIWRLGANEATEIEFFQDVKIDGKTLKKGRYTLYALVNEDKWTLIFNKETDTWGAFAYDPSKDVLRSTVAVEKKSEITEAFSIAFHKTTPKAANLVISWDDVLVELPIGW